MLPYSRPVTICALAILLLCEADCFAQGDDPAPKLLRAIPEIRLGDSGYVATRVDPIKIDALIDKLSEITDPDFGFAPWMSGVQFAPIADSGEFGAGIIMISHGIKTNEALRELVALGPQSLPKLLDRLTDNTPTQLTMKHEGSFGAQWYGREVSLNLARSVERKAKERFSDFFNAGERFSAHDETTPAHVVTIGDVCFVIIGQIVNRGYQCARYQPTACRVINSPTHDPEIARITRAIWTADEPAQSLFNSLMEDLFTADADWYQSGAAMRLLYFFPDQSAPLIRQRISGFDIRDPKTPSEWEASYKTNGVEIGQFLEAVRTSGHPVIVDALIGVVQRTNSPNVMQASINRAVIKRDPEMVFNRIQGILSRPPPSDQGPFGGEYELLKSSAKHFPERSKQVFESYCTHGGIATLRSCIHALREPVDQKAWMITFLSSLLDDKRDTGWEYGPDYDRHPIRICDEAAKTLANDYLTDVRFEYEKDASFLDQQIGKIERVLAGEKDVSFENHKASVRPHDFPVRAATRVVQRPESLWRIHSLSDRNTIWAQFGDDALAIDTHSGEVTRRVPLERPGRESYLENGKTGRTYAYYGDTGGNVLVRDTRTGKVIHDVPTPFHDGVGFGDPLQIRNLQDVTMSGKVAEWIIAVTADGAIHSIEVDTGRHRVEQKVNVSERGFTNVTVLGAQASSMVLIEGLGGEGLFDAPLHLWDQSKRTLRTIEKVPRGGWSAFWGELALNSMNGHHALWNVVKARQLEIPWPQEAIRSVQCSHDGAHLFVLRDDGSVDMMKVLNGSSVQPVRRFLPAAENMADVLLTLSSDDQTLFVHWNSDGQAERNRGNRDEWTKIAVYSLNDEN